MGGLEAEKLATDLQDEVSDNEDDGGVKCSVESCLFGLDY